MEYTEMKKAIIRSQHCQRNWDLNKDVPEEDVDMMKFSVANCPSKQNIAFYNAHFVTDRDLIEFIHNNTEFTNEEGKSFTNSQTLANVLVVFEPSAHVEYEVKKRNEQVRDDEQRERNLRILHDDQQQAIGIAAGYLNVVASLMGYSTGCCKCMDSEAIRQKMGLKKAPVLLMGVGHKDETRNRREHHLDSEYVFATHKKQAIAVTDHK